MTSGVTRKTGFYSIYSVVGLGLKKVQNEMLELEGELLTEAILDKIRGIWNRFKKFLARVWERAKRWIGNNWRRLIEFLALEPVVYHNNRPRW